MSNLVYLFQNMSNSSTLTSLNLLFAVMMLLQLVFLFEIFSEIEFGAPFQNYRGGWLLAQGIGSVVLFVDMVIRFDQLAPSRRPWHVAGVGLCSIGWCCQFFVHYLDSALLS